MDKHHTDIPEESRPPRRPCVSVVLPVFNAAATLANALSSILGQEGGVELEVIAVDDGSKDDSSRLLAEASERDPRVRTIVLPHRGLVPTLQAGLAEARGQLIARMDADDVALPDRIVKQMEFLRMHPKVVAVGGAARFLINGQPSSRTVQLPLGGEEIMSLLERESPLIHPTVLIRREALERVGGYRSAFRHAEDYDLWLRLAENGELANIPDVVLHYRLDEGQVTIKHLEASMLAKLGARTCARYRRSDRADPAPTDGVIDREWLVDHDWSGEAIDALLLDTFVDRIWWLVGIGMFEAAESLTKELGRMRMAPSVIDDHRFRWRWEAARVAWCSHRRATAVIRMSAAFTESPRRWFGRLFGRVRGLGDGGPDRLGAVRSRDNR